MSRERLTPAVITRTAANLVDKEGRAALSLARVAAALGVKPPSLYSHVDGMASLERLVALEAVEGLVEQCRTALVGRSGTAGLRAVARAYRCFATTHPGTYPLAQVARPGDPEYEAKADRLLEALFVLLSGLGVPERELVHATRALRSALHGFVMLEIQGGFGLDVDVEQSFGWLLDSMERALTTPVDHG